MCPIFLCSFWLGFLLVLRGAQTLTYRRTLKKLSAATALSGLKTKNKREAVLLLHKYNALEVGIDPNSRVNGKPLLGKLSPVDSISLNPTFEEYWPKHEQWAQSHKRERSLVNDKEKLDEFIRFKKPKRLGDVTKKDVERFKEYEISRKIAKGTINSKIRTLKAIWNRAIKNEFYDGPNPFKNVDMYRLAKRPKWRHTRDELWALLWAAIDSMDEDLIALVLLCGFQGLRQQECMNLRLDSIDFDSKLIRIKYHELFEPKDHEERDIQLQQITHEYLLPIVSKRKSKYPDWPYLFRPGKIDKTLSANKCIVNLRERLKSLKKSIDLPLSDPHQSLRRTYGGLLLEKTRDMKLVSRRLGHSSIVVTEQHYADIIEKYTPDDDFT